MNNPIIEHLQDKIDELKLVEKAQSEALAKRKEDIDKLTAELETAKKIIAEQQAKLNWIRPIASMAVINMRNNADGCDVEYTCDDILSQIRSLR